MTSRCSGQVLMNVVQRLSYGLRGPAPVLHIGHILTVFADVKLVTLHRAPVTLCRRLLLFTESWNPADGVERKLVAVEVIQYDHVKGGCRGAFLLVATHMKIVMVVPRIGQPVNDSRIAMDGKDHRLVACEQRVEILLLQPMRVLRLWL